jgi:hypothetical protein
MIGFSDQLYNSYRFSPQLANMWDFYLTDWEESDYEINRFKVIETSVPMLSLETESRSNGEKVYVGYAMPESFSITFREDSNFSVFNYFKEWEREVFDQSTGQFKSRDRNSGQYKSPVRTGTLLFQKSSLTMQALSSTSQTLNVLQNGIIASKNAVYQKIRGSSPFSANISTFVGNQIRELASTVPGLTGARTNFFSKMNDLISVEVTKSFTYHNVRFKGIQEVSASYENSDELQITIDLTLDAVTDDLDEASRNSSPIEDILQGNLIRGLGGLI